MLRIGSLFAGIGGFDLAAERLGMEVAWQIEIDRFARRVLEKHWPNTKRYEDIRTVEPAGLPPVDILCGGWPCQGNSVAGKRQGHADERSGLFSEILRLVDGMANRPRFLCLENVPGLVSVNEGRDFRAVIHELQRRGYVGCVRNLDAQYAGLAQRRPRLFFVAGLGARGRRAIQLVLEGGKRYPAPCRESGEATPAGVGEGAYSDSGPGWWRDGIGTLRAEGENRPSRPSNLIAQGAGDARALNAKGGSGRMDGESETFVAFDWQKGNDKNNPRPSTMNFHEEQSPTLGSSRVPAIAKTITANYGKQVDSSDTSQGPPNLVVSALRNSGRDSDTREGRTGIGLQEDVCYTLQAEQTHAIISRTLLGKPNSSHREDQETYIAFSGKDHGGDAESDLSPTLRAGVHQGSHANAGVPPAVAWTVSNNSGGYSWEREVSPTIGACAPSDSRSEMQYGIRQGAQVRRLSATECERLMGLSWRDHETGEWQDGHTCLCGKNRGRSVAPEGEDPCSCADGPRYRVCGNGVAIPCVEWLFRCLVAAEEGEPC